eukprot:1925886-Lingulodinium_polyedra.AAC.1
MISVVLYRGSIPARHLGAGHPFLPAQPVFMLVPPAAIIHRVPLRHHSKPPAPSRASTSYACPPANLHP